MRVLVAAGGGWLSLHWVGTGLPGVFVAAGIGVGLLGGIVAWAMRPEAWSTPAPR